MYKIMIIEDDLTLAGLIKSSLSKWGYEVFCVEDFFNVMDDFTAINPHLLMIDINLPYFNGYHWCAMIRKVSKIPIIFISSALESMNIIMAINMGADDYVTKPFDNNVFLAKVQGLLRRSYEFGNDQSLLEHQGVILNLKSTDLVFDGKVVTLTKNEFQILRVLFEHSDGIVARDDLMKELWNSDFFIDDNTLSVNVARLRKKLEEHGLKNFIETKKGIGYGLINGHTG